MREHDYPQVNELNEYKSCEIIEKNKIKKNSNLI